MPAIKPIVRVQSSSFNIGEEIQKAHDGNHSIGAVVSFSGYCRDENATLSALELEHYPEMSEKQIQRIANKAIRQWDLRAITIIHRFGKIAVGEQIVLVITASPHRREAFEAASFLIDFLKTEAPFWKKEYLKNGEALGWVEPQQKDIASQDGWHNKNQ